MVLSSLSSLDAVRIRRFVPRERAGVWLQLSNQALRGKWWPDSLITVSVGGEVRASRRAELGTAVFVGEVDVLVEGHALGFVWTETGRPRPTSVLMTLSSALRGTEVDIVEVGFSGVESTANRISRAEQEWTELLAQLAQC